MVLRVMSHVTWRTRLPFFFCVRWKNLGSLGYKWRTLTMTCQPSNTKYIPSIYFIKTLWLRYYVWLFRKRKVTLVMCQEHTRYTCHLYNTHTWWMVWESQKHEKQDGLRIAKGMTQAQTLDSWMSWMLQLQQLWRLRERSTFFDRFTILKNTPIPICITPLDIH